MFSQHSLITLPTPKWPQLCSCSDFIHFHGPLSPKHSGARYGCLITAENEVSPCTSAHDNLNPTERSPLHPQRIRPTLHIKQLAVTEAQSIFLDCSPIPVERLRVGENKSSSMVCPSVCHHAPLQDNGLIGFPPQS